MSFVRKSATTVALAAFTFSVMTAGPANAQETGAPAEAEVSVDADEVLLDGPGGEFEVSLAGGSSPAITEAQVNVTDGGTTAELVHEVSNADSGAVAYNLAIPEGASLSTITNDSGEISVMLTNRAGDLLGGIAPVEATDANGAPVRTLMRLQNGEVSQEVIKDETIEFPVNVRAAAGTVWYRNAYVSTASRGYIVNANATALGRKQIALSTHATHIRHVKGLLGTAMSNRYWNWNIEHQFLCHVVGAWFPSGTYNMESWQPSRDWTVIANASVRCNIIK